MKPAIIVLDDFYQDPNDIRKIALTSSFDVSGNYPGVRTKGYNDGGVMEAFEEVLGLEIDPSFWKSSGYNGAFQSVTANTPTWIHSDNFNRYGAIIFLTPNPSTNTGLAFYKHKETGVHSWPNSIEKEANSLDGGTFDNWECVSKIENRYNRCVIFDAWQYHAAEGYMGDSLETSRLFHTFFFNIKE